MFTGRNDLGTLRSGQAIFEGLTSNTNLDSTRWFSPVGGHFEFHVSVLNQKSGGGMKILDVPPQSGGGCSSHFPRRSSLVCILTFTASAPYKLTLNPKPTPNLKALYP